MSKLTDEKEFENSYKDVIARFQGPPKKSSRQVARSILFHIAEEISTILDDKQMTQKGLAEKLSISPSAVTQLLNRSPNISIERLARIAIALDMDLDVSLRPKDLPAEEQPELRSVKDRPEVAIYTIENVTYGPIVMVNKPEEGEEGSETSITASEWSSGEMTQEVVGIPLSKSDPDYGLFLA